MEMCLFLIEGKVRSVWQIFFFFEVANFIHCEYRLFHPTQTYLKDLTASLKHVRRFMALNLEDEKANIDMIKK